MSLIHRFHSLGPPWPLQTAKRVIVVAGCLAMAHTQLTTSPATVQIARSLGATGMHIGILGALPMGFVCMQLLAAVAVGRMSRRKGLWMTCSVAQRLMLLPAALGPWLFPQVGDAFWIWTLIALTAVNHAALHFCTPLWLSWMGDYLPRQGLNKFWGQRHAMQQWTAALALLANALFFLQSGVDVRAAFAAIIVLGSVLGVADILMFLRVEEPPLLHAPTATLWDALAGPFRQRDFRGFIFYSCFWNLAAMVGAPFISMYLLEYVGMDLFHVLLLWTISWVGGAILSRRLGGWAERFGQRPVLVLCTAFKSINMIGLLACPTDPTVAFWMLAPIFMIDAFLNAGVAIANNGFMIKNSPAENRTMFIAAGSGFAGIVGGVTSIAAGVVMAATTDWSWTFAGTRYINFHILFATSLVLRMVSAGLASWVSEPASATARVVAGELLVAAKLRMQAWQSVVLWWRDAPASSPAIIVKTSPIEAEPPLPKHTRRAA